METTSMLLGRAIPRIGIGCWAIGGDLVIGGLHSGYGAVNDEESISGLRLADELGAKLFDTAPPMVAYRFEDSRSGDCVARHLEGYRGILQVDGYAAYNRLGKADRGKDALTLAGCWAHVRRKFYELHVNESARLATRTVEAMAALWAVEEAVRGQSPQARAKMRQEQSATIVAELFVLWEAELARISAKSSLAEAIRYALSRREALHRFLEDGRIEIDSNIVERQSGLRRSLERTRSLLGPMAAVGPGPHSPPCSPPPG